MTNTVLFGIFVVGCVVAALIPGLSARWMWVIWIGWFFVTIILAFVVGFVGAVMRLLRQVQDRIDRR